MEEKTLISEQEYLRMPFPDREMEYVCGELVERTLPNNEHSETQGELVYRARKLAETLPLHIRPELRLKVAPGKYRVIDIAIYAGEKPVGLIPVEPPLVAIEILSPDDTLADIMQRLKEYQDWGVVHVWLADPQARKFYVYSRQGLLAVAAFELPEFGARIAADEVFS
jgi:Uma2 family endonuclease